MDEEMQLSGTTAVVVVIQPTAITCANVGDSRAILGRRVLGESSGITCTPLSLDQTPELAKERYRITSRYGEDTVSRATDESGREVGPLRVWLPEGVGNGLGLAMTRSLGDIQGKEVGVIPTPEFQNVGHQAGDSCIILASDGLWDMISSEEALRFAMQEASPFHAATKLKKIALQRWNKEEGAAVDDITLTVVFLQTTRAAVATAAPASHSLPTQHGRPAPDWSLAGGMREHRRSSSTVMSMADPHP